MNKICKSVWNDVTQTWVAVSELAKSKGKSNSVTDQRYVFGVVFCALMLTSGVSFADIIDKEAQEQKQHEEVGTQLDATAIHFLGQAIGNENSVSQSVLAFNYSNTNLRVFSDTGMPQTRSGVRHMAMDGLIVQAGGTTGNNGTTGGVADATDAGGSPTGASSTTYGIAVGSMAYGYWGSAAFGDSARSYALTGVALGVNAKIDGETGSKTKAGTSSNAVAVGANSKVDNSLQGISIGSGASLMNASKSMALGSAASVINASNSIALGAGSTATIDNVLSIGSAGAERKIINVEEGTISDNSTEAINGSQLFKTNMVVYEHAETLAIHGDALAQSFSDIVANQEAITENTQNISANKAEIDGHTGNIAGINTTLNSLQEGSAGLIQQDATSFGITVGADKAGSVADFKGTAGVRTLSGVKDGSITAGSTEVVTGNQLFQTQNKLTEMGTYLTAFGGRVGGIESEMQVLNVNMESMNAGFGQVLLEYGTVLDTHATDIVANKEAIDEHASNLGTINTTLNNLQSGSVGLVKQDAETFGITIAKDKAGTVVDFNGTEGVRTLSGLKDGSVAAYSTDAVTGNQLFLTQNSIISNIESGSIGLVKQGIDAGHEIKVAADKLGLDVNFKGVEGVRTLSGLKDGKIAEGSTEAVTGNQLLLTNNKVVSLDMKVGKLNESITQMDTDITGIKGNISTIDGNVTQLGTELTALDSRVDVTEAGIETINGNITNIGDSINTINNSLTSIESGSIGLVKQDAETFGITVASDKAGSVVDFNGSDGVRTLSGVKDGSIAAGSTEAVTGNQLFLTHNSITELGADLTILGGRVDVTETGIESINGDISSINNSLAGIQSGGLGLVQQDAETHAINVATDKAGTMINFNGTDGVRTLSGVEDGSIAAGSTEAVTGNQLFLTHNSITELGIDLTTLGGRVDVTEAGIETISGNITNMSDSINTINNSLTSIESGSIGLVKQDAETFGITVASDKAGSVVDFNGSDGVRTLSGVKDGSIAAGSTEAVTGNQLFLTHNSITELGADLTILGGRVDVTETGIESINGDISSINNSLAGIQSGGLGLVQQDAETHAINVATDKAGTMINFNGTSGVRTLSGVEDGSIAAGSTEAVTGNQLFLTHNSITELGTDLTTLGGRVDVTETDIDTINGNVNSMSSDISTINGHISSITESLGDLQTGSIGLVQQDADSNVIAIAADKGGNLVDFSGIDGARTLSGVKDGLVEAGSTEAVTGSQLFATNSRVGVLEESAVQYDGADKASVSFNATGAAVRLKNVAEGIDDTDAVNVAQLKASGMMDPNGKVKNAVTYDDVELNRSALSRVTFNGLNGTILANVADGRIGSGSKEAINGGQLAEVRDQLQSSLSDLSGRVDELDINGSGGSGPWIDGQGDKDTESANATGAHSVATGANAAASGKESTALGANSTASADNSVALGAGSVADRENIVSVGSAGNERVVANVQDGVHDTDAVNVRQFNQVKSTVFGLQQDVGRLQEQMDNVNDRVNTIDSRVKNIGAMSAAMSTMTASAAGIQTDNRLAIGAGTYRGTGALAIGYQRKLSDNAVMTFGGSTSGKEYNVGVGLGLGW